MRLKYLESWEQKTAYLSEVSQSSMEMKKERHIVSLCPEVERLNALFSKI